MRYCLVDQITSMTHRRRRYCEMGYVRVEERPTSAYFFLHTHKPLV